eukprot:CAMPEP_0194131078 /NCGR_PEP_ID=MMETSP0152-20130528/1917_1 /TAXON_ID=1049557 /ORGANISM="Thalassiothrix antarctica, Strain L6-D1" /LENGTH=152 /DNA_ID=CAMNT_0038825739 /DNA_START=116 /DNA_END=574 /DNA_ORIENTATION=-
MSGHVENAAFKTTILITSDSSDIAMAAAEAQAKKHGWEVTICVCDAGGIPIQVKRNTVPASYEIAVEKAKTAALFGKPTGILEDASKVAATAGLSSPHALMKGGVPFIIDGVICGSVGVSGVTPKNNEAVAKVAISALADLVWSHRVFEAQK